MIGPTGFDVVLEANAEVIPYLFRNRDRNSASISIVHAAISDASVVAVKPLGDFLEANVSKSIDNSIPVMGMALDDLFRKFGRFAVLICDIEGREDVLLEQFPKLARYFDRLIIEFHPEVLGTSGCDKLREMFCSLGFQIDASAGQVEAFVRI